MPREKRKLDDAGVVVCQNRRYMSAQFLSSVQLCAGCQYEVHDLFSGTSGLQVWAWYCQWKQPDGSIQDTTG